MASSRTGSNRLKAIAAFLSEHFTPLESFRHSAHLNLLNYHDKVGIRVKLFKAGNHVEFNDNTIFSSKVQIRVHAKQAWTDFKSDRKQYLADENVYLTERKNKEKYVRNARQEMESIALDIENRAKRGEQLTQKEGGVLRALSSNREQAIKDGTRALRDRTKKELEADELTHRKRQADAKAQTRQTIESWRQHHGSLIETLEHQRKHATKKWARQQWKALTKNQGQGLALTIEERNFVKLVNSVGERRAAREVRHGLNNDIHAANSAFLASKSSIGSPGQRLMARLQIVSSEAVQSIVNIGKNAMEASVFVGNRADAAIQLGFDVTVDYAQGLAHSAYEGTKSGAHAATVKPLKAAVRRLF